jgi:selenide,water dikinase
LDLALGNRTGGGANNASYFGDRVTMTGVSEEQMAVYYDPQTSGGLLASLDPRGLTTVLHGLASAGVDAQLVGRVVERAGASTLVRVAPGLPLPGR